MKKITFLIIGMVITSLSFSQTVLFEDNFDAYTVGEGIAHQSTDWWQWDNQNPPIGASGDALISSAQSVSASNSMNVVNGNDIVYRFGNPTSGRFTTEFSMFINDDELLGGYFNVEHNFGTNWAFSIFFGEDGNISYDVIENTNIGTYNKNVWFNVKLDFNINDDLTTIFIDGDSLTSFPFTFSASNVGTDLNKLDCINFYGANGGTTPPTNSNYFIDNFKYTEIVAETPANLVINETPITVNPAGGPEQIHFENNGAIALAYRAYAVYEYNSTFAGANEVDVLTYVTNSQAYGASAAGDPEGTPRKMTTRFYNETVQNLIGMTIDSVFFVPGYVQGDTVSLSVLERGSFIDNTNLGAKIQSQSFTIVPSAEQYLALDQPYLLDGEEISVEFGMNVYNTDSSLYFVEYLSQGQPVGAINGNYVNFNSGYTNSFYNNFVLVYCSGVRWPKWLNVDAANGTLAAGASDDINLSFTTTDLTVGQTYNAKVVFGCDAPNKEFSEIPVTFDVIAGVDETNSDSKIGVLSYPNPVTNYFNISSDADITNIDVVSQSGQIIYSNTVNSKTVKVNMEKLPKGVYFAKVTVNNTVVTKKIVKK